MTNQSTYHIFLHGPTLNVDKFGHSNLYHTLISIFKKITVLSLLISQMISLKSFYFSIIVKIKKYTETTRRSCLLITLKSGQNSVIPETSVNRNPVAMYDYPGRLKFTSGT